MGIWVRGSPRARKTSEWGLSGLRLVGFGQAVLGEHDRLRMTYADRH